MTILGVLLSLLVGIGALTWAYSRAGLDTGARLLVILAILWLVAYLRRWRWFAAFGLLTFIAYGAYGLWLSLPPGLMIVGALGGLLAWDLQEFTHRLRYASPADDVRAMEMRHLGRLMIFAFLGFLLAGITTFISMRLTPELVIVLVLLSALGLIQLARWLGSRGE